MTLSEAMARAPKVFSRLYVNMIKAGEAGGALETILQRLAQFLESAESLKRKVKGAMIYPVAVVLVAILILAGIMYFIVPTFKKMFEEFELKLPAPTVLLLAMSDYVVKYFWLMILLPVCCWLIGKIVRKFKHGRVATTCSSSKCDFRIIDRAKHFGQNDQNFRHVDFVRCSDFGSPQHHAGDRSNAMFERSLIK